MAEHAFLLESAEGLTVEVSPLGGAILSAKWHGTPFLAQTPTPGLASQVFGSEACFPLVPFGNRIENNGFQFDGRDYRLVANTADPLVLHGDGWLGRWSVQHRDRQAVTLRLRQEASTATPFAYEAVETIAVDGTRLIISLSVTNEAAEPLPYGLGFHPYFPRSPDMRLFARAGRYWTEREGHLPGSGGPTPETMDFASGSPLPVEWLNNAFDGWDGRARIEWPETGLAVSLEADGNLRYFVLYSPSATSGFFCFEPMSHRPNAHRDLQEGGLVRLQPHETMTATMALRIEGLVTR
ncbi:MAG TPA: aldose 1-epimerase [Ensifer sp.]|jgi:aldose 1-epimerase|uniref:aldose 1-epimerase n=1 Tax=Ensifer sp. TaxID=1872086 RepID=UPI002E0DBD5A|nr:aldose 1-epimerase [Ensifer sp.]